MHPNPEDTSLVLSFNKYHADVPDEKGASYNYERRHAFNFFFRSSRLSSCIMLVLVGDGVGRKGGRTSRRASP